MLKFEDGKMETTAQSINLTEPKIFGEVDFITSYETILSKDENSKEKFGILLNLERSSQGTNGILISYHLMCATLVIISSVTFLIDPKDSNRAAVLVALILVLATVFNAAQVLKLPY